MSGTQQALGFSRPAAVSRSWRPPWHGGLRGSEFAWAVAFFVPYVAVFLGFVVYPVAYGLWLGSKPALYADLFANPRYLTTVVNTLVLVGVGVNVKMFLAFLMSGFFMRPGRWIKALLVLYMLPWALPALPAFLSMHWMLIGYGGFLNSALGGTVRHRRADLVQFLWARARRKRVCLYLEMDAVLDAGLPGGAHGDPAGHLRGGRGGRRHRHPALRVRDLPAAGESLSGLARCSRRCGPLATSPHRISYPAARRRCPRKCWPRTASASPSTRATPSVGVAAVMSALPVLIPVALLLIRRLQATEVQL